MFTVPLGARLAALALPDCPSEGHVPLRTAALGTAGVIDVEVRRLQPSPLQRIDLSVRILLVGGDAGIADRKNGAVQD